MIRKQTDKCIKKKEIKCDRPRLRAALTQSNSRIRNELLSSRVTFTCPFDEKASVEREVDDFQALQELVALDNEENQMQTDVSFLSHQKKLTGPDSLLLFEEHDAVHGLFDFLFNRKRKNFTLLFLKVGSAFKYPNYTIHLHIFFLYVCV
jgi:hypothetical protein